MIPATQPNPSITDFIQLQDWLTMMLLCDGRLRQVNAVQQRKLLLDSDMQIDALWQMQRNGGSGLGIIVEDVRESISTTMGSADSPVYDLEFGFVVLEERNINLTPEVGTGITSETCARIITDIFYQENIQPFGQVFARGRINETADDWIKPDTGIYARRTSLKMLNPARRLQRCDMVSITWTPTPNSQLVAINCTSTAPGLQVWYTTDGTFPANDPKISATTQLYAGPFQVAPGTTVTAAAYAPGYNVSAIKQSIIKP